MQSLPLDNLPLAGLLIGFAVLLCLAMEIGYRAGGWRHSLAPGEKESPVGAMVASMLALLALVLGFTFSLAANRFDQRREAVLNEANAIGTTFLRARLLSDPEQAQIQKLLQEYVDVRLQVVEKNRLQEIVTRSEELQELLWKQAIVLSQRNPTSIVNGLFISSLNDVIDMHAKRLHVGVRSRVPTVIWVILIGFALLGLGAVGYQAGISTTRRSPAMAGLAVAFAAVFALIADLDRAQDGFLRVGQQSMVDAQRSMAGSQPTK